MMMQKEEEERRAGFQHKLKTCLQIYRACVLGPIEAGRQQQSLNYIDIPPISLSQTRTHTHALSLPHPTSTGSFSRGFFPACTVTFLALTGPPLDGIFPFADFMVSLAFSHARTQR